MTQVMALELGASGIRVNTVNPTAIMTDLGRRVWADPEKSKLMLSRIPLGRYYEFIFKHTTMFKSLSFALL